jgi:hypothetical protein
MKEQGRGGVIFLSSLTYVKANCRKTGYNLVNNEIKQHLSSKAKPSTAAYIIQGGKICFVFNASKRQKAKDAPK